MTCYVFGTGKERKGRWEVYRNGMHSFTSMWDRIVYPYVLVLLIIRWLDYMLTFRFLSREAHFRMLT